MQKSKYNLVNFECKDPIKIEKFFQEIDKILIYY